MNDKVNQSKSTVYGDQIAGDKIDVHMQIVRELAPAIAPIRKYADENNNDPENTILIRKLKDGRLNKNTIEHAIKSKASYYKTAIEFKKTADGKRILKDIEENLVMLINNKYISQMDEGDVLKTSLSSIVEDFSAIVNKYKDVMTIDEAFVEGLLYVATSECAINWMVEGF